LITLFVIQTYTSFSFCFTDLSWRISHSLDFWTTMMNK
jgi:hypothetical protein